MRPKAPPDPKESCIVCLAGSYTRLSGFCTSVCVKARSALERLHVSCGAVNARDLANRSTRRNTHKFAFAFVGDARIHDGFEELTKPRVSLAHVTDNFD